MSQWSDPPEQTEHDISEILRRREEPPDEPYPRPEPDDDSDLNEDDPR